MYVLFLFSCLAFVAVGTADSGDEKCILTCVHLRLRRSPRAVTFFRQNLFSTFSQVEAPQECNDLGLILQCTQKCSQSKVANYVGNEVEKVNKKYCSGGDEQAAKDFFQSAEKLSQAWNQEVAKDAQSCRAQSTTADAVCKATSCVVDKLHSSPSTQQFQPKVVEFDDAGLKFEMAIQLLIAFGDLPASCDFLHQPNNTN